MYSVEKVVVRVEKIIRISLKLGDDVTLRPESDLVSEVGLDSIEAFEALATLHEMLGVRIPDDINPGDFGSIGGIAEYILRKFDADTIDKFMNVDIDAYMSSMYDDGEFA
ncbi:acyl carrier protein [Massilia sp. GER05]|uniref:acyl carrier protein n=1 Tax=Massilia sp. GER05 TaxID=3394605 RepID=UPI003F83ACA0